MSTPAATARPPRSARVTTAALPVAAAIGVFGVVYGAAAQPILGTPMALLSSVILFSGAAQFTMLALVAAGASPVGLLGAVAALALRHLPLGAVLRPRLPLGRGRRALLSFFLIDETTGLAVTLDAPAERTIAITGAFAYGAWVVGTAAGVAGAEVGVAGGGLGGVESLAAALFPVLFVGLAALTVRRRSDAWRAVAAGAGSVALLLAWPSAGALGVLAVAAICSAGPRS